RFTGPSCQNGKIACQIWLAQQKWAHTSTEGVLMSAITFWDGVHAARPQAVDPQPNARLVETVTNLPPGDVLDLGCGDGGDALWLARRGWHVTAVDISAVAVERLDVLARSQGLGDRVIAVRHDLHESFPQGGFDLI